MMSGFGWDEALAPLGERELGILCSYFYHRKHQFAALKASGNVRLFVDSGAFSAHSSGKRIDVDNYSEWLMRVGRWWDVAAALDVLYDHDATWRNVLAMRVRGIRHPNLLPTVHIGSDPDLLRRYAGRGHNYVALGGLVSKASGGRRTDRATWIDECFEVAAQVGVGLHGFGVTEMGALVRWPWRSTDSSTWAVGQQYGNITMFDPVRGRWHGQRRMVRENVMRHAALVRRYGFDPAVLSRRLPGWKDQAAAVVIQSFVAVQRWIRHRGGHPDFTLYLSASSPQAALQVLHHAQQLGTNPTEA